MKVEIHALRGNGPGGDGARFVDCAAIGPPGGVGGCFPPSRLAGQGLAHGQLEAVEVHHFGPGGDEVADELGRGVGAGVHFSQGAELGVGAKDEINPGAGPFDGARFAVAPFEDVGVL